MNSKLGANSPDSVTTLTREDLVAAMDYLINLYYEVGIVDDIDHLGNRRIRAASTRYLLWGNRLY